MVHLELELIMVGSIELYQFLHFELNFHLHTQTSCVTELVQLYVSYYRQFQLQMNHNVKCSIFVISLGYQKFTTQETPDRVDSGTNSEQSSSQNMQTWLKSEKHKRGFN